MDDRVQVVGCCFGIPFGCGTLLLLVGSLIAWGAFDLGWFDLGWFPL